MFPLQNIFDALVHVVATFGAAVLSHPAMQGAAADVMVLGMNRMMTQQDLDEKLRIMDSHLKESYEDMAHQAGAEFPTLVGNFFKGWSGKDKEESDKKQEALASEMSSAAEQIVEAEE